MPTHQEPLYCTQQINIPAELPDILKQYAKAAIRTQPRDLLVWSAAYFRALANGEKPPVKERIEFPEGKSGLTIGILRVLHRQLGENKTVAVTNLARRWDGLCLESSQLNEFLQIGNFRKEADWLKFLAIASSSLGKNLQEAVQVFCEVYTDDPEGGAAMIPYQVFAEVLQYLAKKDPTIPKESVSAVLHYLEEYSDKQEGMVAPRNLLQSDCPKLLPDAE